MLLTASNEKIKGHIVEDYQRSGICI